MASILVLRWLIRPRTLVYRRTSWSNATSCCKCGAPSSRIILHSHYSHLPIPLLRPTSHPNPLPRCLSTMATPQNSSPTKTERVVIKGRVQGVFYRDWTVENATQLGLKGWVRNRKDGSVEALFSGSPDSVQEMERRCRRGPPDAVVTGFEVFPSNDDPGNGFQRKPTV